MIRGYRCWDIVWFNGQLTLRSPANRYYWKPEEAMALCKRCLKTEQFMDAYTIRVEIAEDCTCGLYALKTPEAVLEQGYHHDILGEVLLYGKVIEGKSGYRAEKAKVSVLFIPPVTRPIPVEQLEELSRNYNAPLVRAPDRLYEMICAVRRDHQHIPNRGMSKGGVPRDRYGRTYWGDKSQDNVVSDRSLTEGG